MINKQSTSLIRLAKKVLVVFAILIFASSLLLLRHIYFPAKHLPSYPTYEGWDNGSVRHILPAANHQQFLVKVSFKAPLAGPPNLVLSDSLNIQGQSLESTQRFWEFFVNHLNPNTSYSLQLETADQTKLADKWDLRTYPHPDSSAQELTILAFTCAGGVKERVLRQELFLKTEFRHLLLKRGLSFNPDVVIANGDHIYWDRQTMDKGFLKKLVKLRLDNIYGHLDLNTPMSSEKNLSTITQIADAQIAELYGCLLRSTPTYFLPDDHDLLENDEAHEDLVTLPPKLYGIEGQGLIQKLYYPEFLSDRNRPLNLPGAHEGRNKHYGTLRYGKLLESVLYDCKRHSALLGEEGILVARAAEDWIKRRTLTTDTRYIIHIPSTPFGLTAGKWSEWYPDVFQADGEIGVGETEKFKWQTGWWLQHQRILKSWRGSKQLPIIIQGDLHNSSYAKIYRSGNLDFGRKPIHVIGSGTLGSGKLGFPSSFRGTTAKVPKDMDVEEILPPIEKNGFSILSISESRINIKMYTWRPEDGLEAIEDLEPILEREIERPEGL